MANATLPQLNLVDFEPQIIWLVIVFAAFYMVVKVKIVPYFSSETENREHYVNNNHLEARKMQKKAERLADDYNEKMQAVHLRANDLVAEAKLKYSQRIEVEKNRINQDATKKLSEHYGVLRQEIDDVDQQLQESFSIFKVSAMQKLGLAVLAHASDNVNDNLKRGGM